MSRESTRLSVHDSNSRVGSNLSSFDSIHIHVMCSGMDTVLLIPDPKIKEKGKHDHILKLGESIDLDASQSRRPK